MSWSELTKVQKEIEKISKEIKNDNNSKLAEKIRKLKDEEETILLSLEAQNRADNDSNF